MGKFNKILVIGLVLGLVSTSWATVVTLDAVADSHVASNSADYNYGTETGLSVYNKSTNTGCKAYMRFELPADFGTATSATMRIVVSYQGKPWNSSYNVYGLNDTASGQDWGETTITWNNAPANDTSSSSDFTSDATNVGSFGVTGYKHVNEVGAAKTVSTAELLSFINADTDRAVTLMINDINTYNASNAFASRENTTYAAPQLVMDYTPIPEPATIGLLTLGFGFLYRRRK